MEITINTGLDRFVLVDKIHMLDKTHIRGTRTFINTPVYLGIESLAQLGAFHVRCLIGFKRHAFLLKITRCITPAHEKLNGTYALTGKLVSNSASAFSYVLQAMLEGNIQMEGEFLFATTDYDHGFKKDILEKHYRNLLSCLKNDSRVD
jgi:hypothetical protein